jgi:hypothetical protein
MGGTAIEDAIRHGRSEVQALLRSRGALLTGHAEAMCKASATGSIDSLRVLISNGVDPNAGDHDGRTALHLSASCNQLGAIHFLLNYHTLPEYAGVAPCNINPIDSFGGTPLDDALRHQNEVVAILLRGHGGICRAEHSNDPAMDEARRQQEHDRRVRLRAEVAAAAHKLTRASTEAKRLSAFESHAEYLHSKGDKVLKDAVAVLKVQLELFVVKEREHAAKSRLKRIRTSDHSARMARVTAMQAASRVVAEAVSECQDALEHPPTVALPAQRILAMLSAGPTLADEEGAESMKEPLAESRQHRLCLSAVLLLYDVVACLEDIL